LDSADDSGGSQGPEKQAGDTAADTQGRPGPGNDDSQPQCHIGRTCRLGRVQRFDCQEGLERGEQERGGPKFNLISNILNLAN
jgi:hypothetical protein